MLLSLPQSWLTPTALIGHPNSWGWQRAMQCAATNATNCRGKNEPDRSALTMRLLSPAPISNRSRIRNHQSCIKLAECLMLNAVTGLLAYVLQREINTALHQRPLEWECMVAECRETASLFPSLHRHTFSFLDHLQYLVIIAGVGDFFLCHLSNLQHRRSRS